MKTEKQNLLKNITLFALNGAGPRLVVFMLVPLYARFMSKSEYGSADLINNTVSVLLVICTLKISAAVLRLVMDQTTNKAEVLSNALFIVWISSLVITLLTVVLVTFWKMDGYVYFIPIIYLLSALRDVTAQYCKAIGKTVVYAFDGFVSAGILLGGSIIFLVWFHAGIYGYFSAIAISNVISIIYLLSAGKIKPRFSISDYRNKTMREMLRFSCPLIPNSISWRIIQFSDHYMVVWFIGIAANGYYSIAYKIPAILGVVSDIFIQAWLLSAIDEYENDHNYSKFEKVYHCFETILFVSSSLIICCNRLLSNIIFGPEFELACKYTPFLIFAALFSNIQSFFSVLYSAAKKTKSLMCTTILGAVVNIVLNAIFIPVWGVYGAIIGTCVSYILIAVLRISESKRFISFNIDCKFFILNAALLFIQACNDFSNNRCFFIINIVIFVIFCLLNAKRIQMIVKNALELIIKIKLKYSGASAI